MCSSSCLCRGTKSSALHGTDPIQARRPNRLRPRLREGLRPFTGPTPLKRFFEEQSSDREIVFGPSRGRPHSSSCIPRPSACASGSSALHRADPIQAGRRRCGHRQPGCLRPFTGPTPFKLAGRHLFCVQICGSSALHGADPIQAAWPRGGSHGGPRLRPFTGPTPLKRSIEGLAAQSVDCLRPFPGPTPLKLALVAHGAVDLLVFGPSRGRPLRWDKDLRGFWSSALHGADPIEARSP